jgi:exodeoxyribonuclease X
MPIIRVFDLETTGDKPPEAAVCEIGWYDLRSTMTDLLGRPAGWVVTGGGGGLVNPGHPIPPVVSAIHHIVDEDVKSAPPFDMAVEFAMEGERPIALAAHSANFERMFLTDELMGGLPWICTYKGALRKWQEAPSHSNQALRYWRKPEGLQRELAAVAHRAQPDAYVTAFHLRDLLEVASIEELILWTGEPALQVWCRIGAWRDHKWTEVDSGFMRWILARDFDEDVKFTCRHHLALREKEREQHMGSAADDDGIPY